MLVKGYPVFCIPFLEGEKTMQSIIEQLYYGHIPPCAKSPALGEQERKAGEDYDRAYDAFVNKLEPQLRREFHDLLQAHTQQLSRHAAGSFAQGCRLGARLMLDMLQAE